MKDVNVIFGLDKNGKDIFVVNKNNFFHCFNEPPTYEQLSDLCLELGLSNDDVEYIKVKLKEWLFMIEKQRKC